MNELPMIQKTYDLIKWYVPILNRLPRNHKFLLGDRCYEPIRNRCSLNFGLQLQQAIAGESGDFCDRLQGNLFQQHV